MERWNWPQDTFSRPEASVDLNRGIDVPYDRGFSGSFDRGPTQPSPFTPINFSEGRAPLNFGEDFATGSVPPVEPAGGGWWDSFSGSITNPKNLSAAKVGLGAIQGVGNLWLGSQQLKLGKDALRSSKRQFSKQFDAQRQSVNRDIRERGEARFLGRGGTGETAEQYYEKHRIR